MSHADGIKYCSDRAAALPSVREIQDLESQLQGAQLPNFKEWVWSSTEVPSPRSESSSASPAMYFIVSLAAGAPSPKPLGDLMHVRCVRRVGIVEDLAALGAAEYLNLLEKERQLTQREKDLVYAPAMARGFKFIVGELPAGDSWVSPSGTPWYGVSHVQMIADQARRYCTDRGLTLATRPDFEQLRLELGWSVEPSFNRYDFLGLPELAGANYGLWFGNLSFWVMSFGSNVIGELFDSKTAEFRRHRTFPEPESQWVRCVGPNQHAIEVQ